MIRKLLYGGLVLVLLCQVAYGKVVDASKLLPPEQAFVPQVQVSAEGINVQFQIADGYYLYQSKIEAATDPEQLLAQPKFSQGEIKEDEFFGKQTVYYRAAQVVWAYRTGSDRYKLTLSYQGCADVGVCYPPSETTFEIQGSGVYQANTQPELNGKARFLAPDAAPTSAPDSSRFKLSWETLNANLLAFFLAGLGLSFTACMYPLIPIVSSIVVGDKQASKGRALALTVVYTQGLALTYTLVGIIAGLTGALLTVWLQQAWVVLAAAGVMVVLALAMFGVFSLQLPSQIQSFFQQQSHRLSGGKLASVFAMGMFSALIVGPCVGIGNRCPLDCDWYVWRTYFAQSRCMDGWGEICVWLDFAGGGGVFSHTVFALWCRGGVIYAVVVGACGLVVDEMGKINRRGAGFGGSVGSGVAVGRQCVCLAQHTR